MAEKPREDMENIDPPHNVLKDGDPQKALKEKGFTPALSQTIEGAASVYVDGCEGGDAYANNCAHYLSNAFLLAGFDELKPPHECTNARCGTKSKRPIRARDMRCWFIEKATKTQSTVPSTGFWAVFQLRESEYWGGHVVILDASKSEFYGTGYYSDWDQTFFQW